MIYGNKFMNYGTDISEAVLQTEMMNLDNLIESFFKENNNTELFDESSYLDEMIGKLVAKIKAIVTKIIDVIKKTTNNIKVKILSLGNTLVKKLDDVIAGKYLDENDPILKDNKASDVEAAEVPAVVTGESALLEEATAIDQLATIKDGFGKIYDFLADKKDEDMLIKFTNGYVDEMITWLKSKNSEGAKKFIIDKAQDYKDKYQSKITESTSKQHDYIKELEDDFNALKSHKGSDDYTTPNGLFKLYTIDIESKDALKDLRSEIRENLKAAEEGMKELTKYLNEEVDFKRNVEKIHDRYQNVRKNYWVTEFGFGVRPENLLNELLSEMTALSTNQYKIYAKMINIIVYFTKQNYKLCFKFMRKWGTKPSKDTKAEK